jgi:opacity protein-like surface antigen
MTKNLLLGCLLLLATANSSAQNYYDFNKRTGKWDISFILQQTGDQDLEFNDNIKLDVEEQIGWGFQFGYNFDQHWNLSFAMDSYRADYDTKGIVDEDGDPSDFRHEVDSFSGQINGTYHFMKGRFTPYVEAGLGWTYLDSNISNGRYYYSCGFGYCSYRGDSYDDSSFSYHTGLGLRYEFGNRVFIKGSLARRWTDLSKASGTPDVDYFRFEIGTLL